MDVLRSFPVRSSDGDEELTNRKKKKKERPITIEIEEEEELPKRQKYDLGLNLLDDYFEIPEIKERPLPREDGESWTFWEEAKQPYGKEYLDEEAERHRILSNNKDYRFVNELAGALRKELSDIIEPEDMARLRQDQHLERTETEIELKRTRIDMDKKYELIQKLKELQKEEERKLNATRAIQLPATVKTQARYLVDNESLPPTTINSYYGFRGIDSLYNTYVEPSPEERQRVVEEELPLERRNESDLWQELFFLLFAYYRDFLNNKSDYSLEELLDTKLRYIIKDTSATPVRIKKENESTTSTTTTTPTMVNDSPSAVILEPLRSYMEEANQGLIDWSLYKKRQTETINMHFFDELDITTVKEEEMARLGALKRYGADHPVYVAKALTYLYGTPDAKEMATKGKMGLSLLSDDPTKGGHPQAINQLIQLQFPAYKEEENQRLPAITLLLRSHFLWLFFDEIAWPEKIDVLVPEAAAIIERISTSTQDIHSVIAAVETLYKSELVNYLRDVAAILSQKTDGVAPISLTPQQGSFLFGKKLEAIERFRALNQAFKGVTVEDIVEDNLFAAYLSRGSNAFLNKQYKPNTMDVELNQAVRLPQNSQYPVLILHELFKAYQEYLAEYVKVATNNIARIVDAIDKATKKIAEVVGDETYSLNRPTDYRQRKTFTTRPENSGFIKMRAEINHLLRKAYLLVNDYAESLRGLPLEGYQTDSAYETGLSTDFITFVATLSADLELMFPDGYRTQKHYMKVKQEKQAIMARLRRYTWSGGSYGRPYIIRKDISMVPCFVRGQPQQRYSNNHLMF